MKDLSYLNVFSSKILREARRILCKGFTVEDIDRFLKGSSTMDRKEILTKTKFGKRKP